MRKTEKLIIGADGVARGIHGPAVASIVARLGDPTIQRASHVEPTSELSRDALSILYDENSDRSRYVIYCRLPSFTFEPNPDMPIKWWAAMLGGSREVLGPFDTREEALAEEVKWLEARNIPICGPCREKPSGT